MNYPGQNQSAEYVDGLVNLAATTDGGREAPLAYPQGNDGIQLGMYNPQHHTMMVQPENEGTTYLSIPGSSYTWDIVPEAFDWSQAYLPPAQLPPEVPHPLPASANEAGYHGSLTATFTNHLGGAPGIVDGFMNIENRATGAERVGPWTIDRRSGCDMAPYLGVMTEGDRNISSKYGTGINFPYIRRTKTGRRAPVSVSPQAFEGSPDILAARLASEGADPGVVDLIHRVIFVAGVTEGALTAPIKSRDLSLKNGGAKRMWHLLLKATDIGPGEKSYCCQLCAEEHRPEYKNVVDGLRHLKRDHFGMSVACQYCGHEFFRVAEMNRHVRGCKKRPATGI